MSNYFTYSVLQYKHNLILGESINVGILFHFPKDNIFEFVKGDGYRAKAIYPDFNNSLFNGYIKHITEKVKNHIDLFNKQNEKIEFASYIHQYILAEDSAGLIFSEPVQVKDVFNDSRKVVGQYAELLLPGIITEKPIVQRHNETYIISTFRGYLQDKSRSVEKKLQRDRFIKTKHFNIKFDLAYNAQTNKFIKPVSFDLTEENSILSKASVIHCHLNDLIDYSKANNASFDFLIAKPQNNQFKKEYENAIDLIESSKAPKQLITQDRWKEYSQSTFEFLSEN
jgi:hypothetical protein